MERKRNAIKHPKRNPIKSPDVRNNLHTEANPIPEDDQNIYKNYDPDQRRQQLQDMFSSFDNSRFDDSGDNSFFSKSLHKINKDIH